MPPQALREPRSHRNDPTLAGLAQLIEQRGAEGESTPTLVRVVRDQPLPLSLWEERIWELSRDREISARYTTARPYRLRDPLNKDALRECLDAMVRRPRFCGRPTSQETASPSEWCTDRCRSPSGRSI